MSTWSPPTWNFATWGFSSGVTWGDLDTWGNLGVWFEPGGFPDMPSLGTILGLDLDDGAVTAVSRSAATMQRVAGVKASMRALGSDGASLGPASVAASGVTLTEYLAPAQRIVEIVAVQPSSLGYLLTVSPVESFPTTGLPVLYGATLPDYTAGRFLWVDTDGGLYLVEP